jgi:hypothetical protein
VAHACDIVDPGQIVSTVGTLLFSWAAGVTVGPLFGAAAMEVIGPRGLFIYSAVASLGLVVFIVMRILQVQRSPAKGGFADIAPTSSATAGLTPRAEIDTVADQAPAPNNSREAEEPDQKADASAVARADTAS